MDILENTATKFFNQKLQEQWRKHGTILMQFGVIIMLVIGAYRLSVAFQALIFNEKLDLYLRYLEVHSWFKGSKVIYAYGMSIGVVYPPASYVILWPILGWLDFSTVRSIWAISTIPMLGLLAYVCIKESTAYTLTEKFFIGSLALCLYPAGQAIYIGQLIIHFIPLLLAGLILLKNSQGRLRYDLLGSSMLILSLVKPSISAPFFWIVLFSPGRLRPIFLVLLGYTAITLVSACFQDAGILTLMKDWLAAAPNVRISHGHANFHKWLNSIGHQNLMMPVSLITLITLGIWTYLFRKVDIWILIGVAALITHFWAHHRLYDDLIIVLPMISLFRISKGSECFELSNLLAAILFTGMWAMLLFVPSKLISSPSSATLLIESLQVLLMIATLVFLLYVAWLDKKSLQVNQTQSLQFANPRI